MLTLISVCLSALVLYAYVIVFVSFHGLPESVSDSYYCIHHKWMFSLMVAVCGGLLLIPWLTLNDDFQCFAFLSVASLMFIAASPAFKEGLTRSVHIGASVVMFAGAILWESFCGGLWMPLVLGIILALLMRRNAVFWLEIGLFTEVYATLIVKLF